MYLTRFVRNLRGLRLDNHPRERIMVGLATRYALLLSSNTRNRSPTRGAKVSIGFRNSSFDTNVNPALVWHSANAELNSRHRY